MLVNNNKRYNLYNFEPDFRNYLAAVINLKPNSVKNYLSDFRHFAGWFEQYASSEDVITSTSDRARLIKGITSADIAAYKSYLTESNIPRRTINRRLSTLRKFFKFSRSQGWIQHIPTKEIHNLGSEKPENKKVTSVQSYRDLNSYKSYLTSEDLKPTEVASQLFDIEEFVNITSSQTQYENT